MALEDNRGSAHESDGNGRRKDYVIGSPKRSVKERRHLRFGVYVRVSRKGGRDDANFHSPTDQKSKCETWAGAEGHEIVKSEEDIDKSGARRSRPGLNKLLKALEAGEIDGIVVAYLDRLTRLSPSDRVRLFEEIKKHDGVIASATEGGIFDDDNPIDGLNLEMFGMVARFQQQQARSRNIESVENAIARGVAPCPTPYGYRRPGKGKPLEPDPATAHVVTEIFQRRVAGETVNRIRDWLESAGIPTRDGLPADHWTTGRVRDILGREAYCGRLRIGHAHVDAPPLVSRPTWERAQVSTGTLGSRRAPALGPVPHLLPRRLVRCGGCGYLMVARPERDGHRRYACRQVVEGSHGCCAPAQIRDASGPRSLGLSNYVETRMFEHLEEDYRAALFDSGAAELARLRAQLEEAEERLNDWSRDWELEQKFGREAYLARGEALHKEVSEAKAAWREALRTSEPSIDIPPVGELRDNWAEIPREERHRILAQAIQAVVVYPTPPQPQLVAEARLLATKGVSPKRIARLFDRREYVIAGWIRNKDATGAEVNGASPERVRIVWWDDPPLHVPRPGKRDWVRRDFPFADAVGMPADPMPVPDYSLDELLRGRGDDALDEVFEVLAESSTPLNVEQVTAALPVERTTRYVQTLLNQLHEQGRANLVEPGRRGYPALWAAAMSLVS
jgi:site-specific DNA recombinase